MIFLTVGTLFPFDRLVITVDELLQSKLIEDRVFAQIGDCTYKPKEMEYTKVLSASDFDRCARQASSLISHAGIGSILASIKYDKALLVMPRLKRYGEHVNDHQLHTALRFQELGIIMMALDRGEMAEQIPRLSSFVPRRRKAGSDKIVERISMYLRNVL